MSKTEKKLPTLEDAVRMDLMSSVSLLQIVLDNKEVFDAVCLVIQRWQEQKKKADKADKELAKVN